MKRYLSPRQAAQSMGVSESSLKRWCDRGALEMLRTTGGHRKIPVAAVVQFVRQNARELVRPELLGLPAQTQSPGSMASAIVPLADALVDGDADALRQSVFSLYFGGHTLASICDKLLTPALAMIGDRWSHGEVEIFEEHRAVEMTVGLLHELRGTIASSSSSAPIAMGGAVDSDVYGLPSQMVELVLLEAGWRATSLGTSLPFATLSRAIHKNRPKLFWLSVSTLDDEPRFIEELNNFTSRAAPNTAVFIGGRGLTPQVHKEMRLATPCESIQQLVAHAGNLFVDERSAKEENHLSC